MTGSWICAESSLGRSSASVVASSAAPRDLFAKTEHAFGQRLGARRASWHVHVDGHDRVYALEGRVAVPELAAARGAVAHRDHPLRLGHLLVQATKTRRHLVGHGARDDHHVRLTRARAEDLGPETREVVMRAGG